MSTNYKSLVIQDELVKHLERYTNASRNGEIQITVWANNRRWCQSYSIYRDKLGTVVWNSDRSLFISKLQDPSNYPLSLILSFKERKTIPIKQVIGFSLLNSKTIQGLSYEDYMNEACKSDKKCKCLNFINYQMGCY